MNCRTPRLSIDVRVPAGFQQAVAFAERHLERFGEDKQRLPARLRASGFDEAHMAARESGAQREIELAHAARGAPLAQEAPERTSMLFMSGR
jgi:hypothetical protein